MAAQVEPGDRHGDNDSDNHGANETDRRQPAIERDMRAERQAICPENFEQPDSPRAHRQAEQSADESQENGFDHYLSDDMVATSVHRSVDGHFFRAVSRADQKEVDEIN